MAFEKEEKENKIDGILLSSASLAGLLGLIIFFSTIHLIIPTTHIWELVGSTIFLLACATLMTVRIFLPSKPRKAAEEIK